MQFALTHIEDVTFAARPFVPANGIELKQQPMKLTRLSMGKWE